MLEKLKIKWVYGICIAFIAINSILIVNEMYWLSILPLAFLILIVFLFRLDIFLLILIFLTPLSIKLTDPDMNIGLALPTEPLLFGIMVLFLLRSLYYRDYPKTVVRHFVSISIFSYLLWMFFTTVTSSIPLVSVKFVLSKLWFIVPMYFFAILLFKNTQRIIQFVWLYVLALLIVAVYTIYNHWLFNFDEQIGHWIMSPFYNDHTAYGAALAMFIPFVFGFTFDKSKSKTMRLFAAIVFVILVVAIILSYCRAAWVSLAGALCVYLLLKFKINYKFIVAGVIAAAGIFFIYRTDIVMVLEKNKQDTSKNYIEHIQSISNISTDASNLERINRWQSAFRMFKERPITGWGPGTYQFKYAPFQHSKEKTIISTNTGDLGNAHSEYIGPLAEQGAVGSLLFILLAAAVIYTAIKVYRKSDSIAVKNLSLLSLLGLVTYYIHGCLNNFLDTDKLSVPFWGFIAIIVALDVTYVSKEKEPLQIEES